MNNVIQYSVFLKGKENLSLFRSFFFFHYVGALCYWATVSLTCSLSDSLSGQDLEGAMWMTQRGAADCAANFIKILYCVVGGDL